MKKHILFLIISLSYLKVLAQVPEIPKWRYGIMGGYTHTFLDATSTSYDGYRSMPSYHFGGIVQYEPLNGIGIQSGLIFIRKGAESYTSRWDTTINLSYIQMPLTLMFGIGQNDVSIFFLRAGVYGAMRMIASKNRSDTWYDPDVPNTYKDPIKEDVSKQFKTFDYGLILGVQAHYKYFFWGANYETGTNVFKSQSLPQAVRNFSFNISVGFLLPRRLFPPLRFVPTPWSCPETTSSDDDYEE